ncbi:MAG: CD225/dispanin family protein [Planctomycetia bacterium]|nr:CD225/dispanin family protein [Planctomycetia bacterium]
MSQNPDFPGGDSLPPLNPEYPIPSPPLPGTGPQVPPHAMPQMPPPVPAPIPNYMVWAILETVCCCLPLGVAGLVYALKANSAAQLGRYEEGMRAAKTAKTCLVVGLLLGILGCFLNILIQFAAEVAKGS